MKLLLLPVLAVIRTWTRFYTSHMPAGVKERRRAEIESDIWESQRAAESPEPISLLLRLLSGIPEDLAWRIENAPAGTRLRDAAAVTGAIVALLAALSVLPLLTADKLPTPRPIPVKMFIPPSPPPPPPPPPPCHPPAFTGGCQGA